MPDARATKVPTPAQGTFNAKAKPLAKASPTRKPVKEPGPTVTPMRSRLAKPIPARVIVSAHQPRQPFLMPPLHRLGARGQHRLAVKHGDGGRAERGVEGENDHSRLP